MKARFAVTIACALLLLRPWPAWAQAPAESGEDATPLAAAATNLRSLNLRDAAAGQTDDRDKTSAAAWGGLIGGGTAVVVTAAAAARYGDNEGGGFCTGCFAQWAWVTVPVGVAVGAGIGFAVDLARRNTAARRYVPGRVLVAPVVAKGGGGVVLSARF